MWRAQPAGLLFGLVHRGVKGVEVAVAKEGVVGEVELASSVLVRVVVAGAREVEPFGVAELALAGVSEGKGREREVDVLALKVEVAFSTKCVRNQPARIRQSARQEKAKVSKRT